MNVTLDNDLLPQSSKLTTQWLIHANTQDIEIAIQTMRIEKIYKLFFHILENVRSTNPIKIAKKIMLATPSDIKNSDAHEHFLMSFTNILGNSIHKNLEHFLLNQALRFSDRTNVELSIRYYQMLADLCPNRERNALHFACEHKDSIAVISFLKLFPHQRSLLLCLDADGYSPFFLAIKNGSLAIVNYVLENNIPFGLHFYPNQYDLLSAVIHEKYDAVNCFLRLFNHHAAALNTVTSDLHERLLEFPPCLQSLIGTECLGISLIDCALENNHIPMAILLRTICPPSINNQEDKSVFKKLIEKIDLHTIDPADDYFAPWIPPGYDILQIACAWDIESLVPFSFSPPLDPEKKKEWHPLSCCKERLNVKESPFTLCIQYHTRIGYQVIESIKNLVGFHGEIITIFKPGAIEFLLHTGKNPYDYLNHQKAYELDRNFQLKNGRVHQGYFHTEYVNKLGHIQKHMDYALQKAVHYFLTADSEYQDTFFIELLLKANGNGQKCIDLCLDPMANEKKLSLLIPVLTNPKNAHPLNINAVGSCGMTLLHRAILNYEGSLGHQKEKDFISLIDMLVSLHAQINIPNNHGETIIDFILEKQHFLETGKDNPLSALHLQERYHTEISSYLVKIGASIHGNNFKVPEDNQLLSLMRILENNTEKTIPLLEDMHKNNIPLSTHTPQGVTLLNLVIEKYSSLPAIIANSQKKEYLRIFETLIKLGARPKICNFRHPKPGNTLLHSLIAANATGDKSFLEVLKSYNFIPDWEDILPLMEMRHIHVIKELLEKKLIKVDESPSCQRIKAWIKKKHTTNNAFIPLAIDLKVCYPHYKIISLNMTIDEKKEKIKELYKDYLPEGDYPYFKIEENPQGGLYIRETLCNKQGICPLTLSKNPMITITHLLQKHFEKRFKQLKASLSNFSERSFIRNHPQPSTKTTTNNYHKSRDLKITPHPFLPLKQFVFNPDTPENWGKEYSDFERQISEEVDLIKRFIESKTIKNERSFILASDHEINYALDNILLNEIIYFVKEKKCLFVYGQVTRPTQFKLAPNIQKSLETFQELNEKKPVFYTHVFNGPFHDVLNKHVDFIKNAEQFTFYHQIFPTSNSLILALKRTENHQSLTFFFENLAEFEALEKIQIRYKRVDLKTQTLTLEIYFLEGNHTLNSTVNIHGVSFWRVREKLSFFNQWLTIPLTLDIGAYQITGEFISEIEFNDPLLEINLNTLITHFDSLRHLKHTIPKEKINTLVNKISEGKLVIHQEKSLLPKARVMLKTIITHFPNLTDNDKLTIFKELTRISDLCIPEINKGLYDIILRWVKDFSPTLQLNGMDYFIAKSLDFAKRTAFYTLADYNNAGLPAETHTSTYIANGLTTKPDAFVLPLDIMTHKYTQDPYEQNVRSVVGNTSLIKKSYSFLLCLLLGHAFIHTFEQLTNSKTETDKKCIEDFYEQLINIIECHLPPQNLPQLQQIEEQIRIKSNELDTINERIEKEIRIQHTAYTEYIELTNTFESLHKHLCQKTSTGAKRKSRMNQNEAISRRKVTKNNDEDFTVISNSETIIDIIENKLFYLRPHLKNILELQQKRNEAITEIDQCQSDYENLKKGRIQKLLDGSRLILNDFDLEEMAIEGLKNNPSFDGNVRPLPGAFPVLTLSINLVLSILSHLKVAQHNVTETTLMRNANLITD